MACGVTLSCSEVLLRLLAIGLSNGAIIALNAIGVTLVYGVVRTINFAHGDLFALMTSIVAWIVIGFGLAPDNALFGLGIGLLGSLGLSIVIGAASNALVERIAFKPFRGRSRISPLIATIGLSFMLYQGALLLRYITNAYIPGEHRSVPGIPELPRFRIPDLLPQADLLTLLGIELRVSFPIRDLLIALLALGFAAAVAWFLRATRTGRALQACAQDPDMARLCGVNPDGTIRLAFAIGGGLAGVAAWIFALYYTHPYTLYGAQSGLIAFTAAVMGGIGRPWGAFISGMLLGLLAAFSDYFIATQWTPVLMLGLLMILLILRPTGIGGEDESHDHKPAQGDSIGQRRKHEWGWLSYGLIALGLCYPLLDRWFGWRQELIITSMLILAILALGLNLVLGFAGMLDLGFAACFAVGAYITGMLTMPGSPLALPWKVDFLVLLLISGGVAALFGLLNGAITLRLRGEYLAIVTLAFGQMVPQLVLNLDKWTNGIRGMTALPAPTIAGISFSNTTMRYYLALGLVLAIAGASLRLNNSRWGRAWAAMNDDEGAANSVGVNTAQGRLLVFALGSALAGMAGALSASVFRYVDPGHSEFRISAMVLAMVVIGGAGSVRGAIIGALLVAGYDQLVIPQLGAGMVRLAEQSGIWLLAVFDPRAINYLSFGLALYLTVLFRSKLREPEASAKSLQIAKQAT
jgi:branched-chain amino acid transport system permease protein